MSDRPSTEADRLEALAETIRISGKAARDHIRALNFDRARVWERIITEKLADLVLGLRYQTGDGVVMCEHCEKCVEEDEAVEDHVAQCWWCIPCSEAAIERSRH